jgi:hypothetical protein
VAGTLTGKKNGQFFTVKNVRRYICCSNCGKKRLVFALARTAHGFSPNLIALDGVVSDSSYDYTCGDQLFGIDEDPVPHPESTKIFHVRTAQTCGMPIKKVYYSCKKGFPSVCEKCGSEDDLVSTQQLQEVAGGTKTNPLCSIWQEAGKKPSKRGKDNKTSSVGARKRGSAVMKSDGLAKPGAGLKKPPISSSADSKKEIKKAASEPMELLEDDKHPAPPTKAQDIKKRKCEGSVSSVIKKQDHQEGGCEK